MSTSLALSSIPRAVLAAPALPYLLALGFIAALSLVAAYPLFLQLILVVVLGYVFDVQLRVVQRSSTAANTQTTLTVELSISVPPFADLAASSILPRARDASKAAAIEALSSALIAVYVLAQVAKTAAMYAAVFGVCALFGVATAAHGTFIAVALVAHAIAGPVDAGDDAIALRAPREVIAADITVVVVASSKAVNTVLAITANADADDAEDAAEESFSGDDEDDTESTVDEALLTPADSSADDFEVDIREDPLSDEEDTIDEDDIYGGLLKLVEAAAASDPCCPNDNDVAELLEAMNSLALSAPCSFDSLATGSPAEACPTDDVDAFFQLTEQLAEANPLIIKIEPADNEDVDMTILLASLTLSGDVSPSLVEVPFDAPPMNVDECEDPAMDVEIPRTTDAQSTSTNESLAVDCLMTDEEIDAFALELDAILLADADEYSSSDPDVAMSLDDQDAAMALLSLATTTPPIPIHIPTSEELDAVFQQALTNCAAAGVSPHDVKVELSDEDFELFERACAPVDLTLDFPLTGLSALADAAATVAPMDVKSESTTEVFGDDDAAQLLLALGATVPSSSDFFAPPVAASSADVGASPGAAVAEPHMRIVTRPMKALPRSRALRRSARLAEKQAAGSAKSL
ncbi:uncharacterized protein BXZ73DRAFT_103485 [Epithele typhae]|uniref:uncharacterized protein n=1 Tax=Epithele typhae TaxID=378194 RepID=UPI002007659E|nr:uncharacterized protein BXZ73DRAFT_103485 [Epithele typhae]KAH9924646.1 hypothetical protein BXZ73DRAFT_103485 [Epithele typhae]